MFVTGIQITITSYTTKAEEVLIFQIRTVTPTKHLKSNQVFTRFQIPGQVKLRFEFTVLTIAHILAVYPQIHVRRYRTEMSKYLFAFPIGRQYNLFSIRTHVIVFRRYLRWVVPELVTPGITYIHIDRITITIDLPQRRYLNMIPTLIIEISTEERCWPLFGMTNPVKLPQAVERHVVR
ncbi:hypothetical protein SDC9_80300 [bioreactor metagenome]|uniref:Uncharacterized protein n=1 Tax=bioreactor metagenome TaxID=1076179 RepID=A0A644YZ15_9ZZZZ